MTPRLLTLSAFTRARFAMARLRTRTQLDTYQATRLKQFLERDVIKVPAYSDTQFGTLADAPIMDKVQIMDAFERYNRLGLGAEQGWKIFAGELAPPPGLFVGASTGTSGNRGLYVVSDAERYEWLGVLLSRALPDVWRRSERVAIILPQTSALYDAANESGRLRLEFFGLAHGVEAIIQDVSDFDPSVLVAPPRVLTALAEAGTGLAPRFVFSGAEVLDPADRKRIAEAFGNPVREIYMATEGLFAISCKHGSLHLIEDRVAFEWETVGDGDWVTPIVTDFTRRTQIMLRYRMNDLLRLGTHTCPCGSPHQIIDEIVGRRDDVFQLVRQNGDQVTMTPDVIRNAVLDADRRILDYCVTQTGARTVELKLPTPDGALLPAATERLGQLFSGAGLVIDVQGKVGLSPETGYQKQRRVRVEMEPSD